MWHLQKAFKNQTKSNFDCRKTEQTKERILSYITIVGWRNNIFKLFCIENVDCHKVTFCMSVLASFGSGDLNNLFKISITLRTIASMDKTRKPLQRARREEKTKKIEYTYPQKEGWRLCNDSIFWAETTMLLNLDVCFLDRKPFNKKISPVSFQLIRLKNTKVVNYFSGWNLNIVFSLLSFRTRS